MLLDEVPQIHNISPSRTWHALQVVVSGESVHAVPQPSYGPGDASNPNYVAIDPNTGAGFTINNPGESKGLVKACMDQAHCMDVYFMCRG